MTDPLDQVQSILADSVVDDPESGKYLVSRQTFTDEDIFELEMKYLFERNWVYLAHELQIPNPGDYFTTYIGRQAVVVTRDREGRLHGLVNACAHKGAMICRRKTDQNKLTFTCPFHGWTYSNAGKLLKVKDPDGAGYPQAFNREGSHNLPPIRLESYRGFLFGSMKHDVAPLAEHLGDATKVIDLLIDQSPEGLEVLRGSSTYTYDGNWKLQAENGADGYHVTSVHWNYAQTTARRRSGESHNKTKALDAGNWGKQGGGYWAFPNGHICLWSWAANPQDRPLWGQIEQLRERLGTKGDFMVKGSRNLLLYPNVYLMDQFSTQIRHFRPIAVNKTEVTIYCIAPKGESAKARAARIRQYEDFFHASGMATPDDMAEFRACQSAYVGAHPQCNDMSRGAEHWIDGPDQLAKSLGMSNVISSGRKNEDEGLYPPMHGYWLEKMRAAVEQERAARNATR